jgi:thiosulfate/3-mercaptopyruvate sulfurtransferase
MIKGKRKLPSIIAGSMLTISLVGCAAAGPEPVSSTNQVEAKAAAFDAGVTTMTTTEGLVPTDWLELNLDDPDLVILQIATEDGLYERGHIPGAHKLDWYSGLTGGESRGIIDPASFQEVTSSLGINQDSKVIVYGETHQLFATWAVWVLKVYGFNNVRLLDGGWSKWQAEGKQTSLAQPTAEPGDFVPTEANLELRAFIEEVVATASAGPESNAIIVDNRTLESYVGEAASGATFDGHVASAENLFSFALFNEDVSYIAPEEIANAYQAIGVTPDKEVIVYCGTGLLASASWFALTQILGFEDVKNYDGSWTEYGNAENVPIENGAS